MVSNSLGFLGDLLGLLFGALVFLLDHLLDKLEFRDQERTCDAKDIR